MGMMLWPEPAPYAPPTLRVPRVEQGSASAAGHHITGIGPFAPCCRCKRCGRDYDIET